MSFLSRGLYPQESVIQSWTTVKSALDWAGVPAEQWTVVSAALGCQDTDEQLLVAAVPPHLLLEAIATWVNDSTPTTADKVRMCLALNALRLKFNMEVVDLIPPPPGASPAAMQQPAAPASVTNIHGLKVKLSQVIDQGSDQEIPMLPQNVLTDMRKRYITLYGDPPLQTSEVSDAQLTALNYKTSQGLAPYADFGVWGPYGARIERRMKFVSHVMNPDGTWRTVELPGADCLDTWRSCWAVFKTAAIMNQTAMPATLDRYEQMFVERCRRYPDAWFLCAQADIRARSELLIEERRKQELFHAAHPTMSALEPSMPWNSVLKAAAGDTEFWDRELKEPALLYAMGRGRNHPSFVHQQTEVPAQGDRGGKRKRHQQQQRQEHQEPQQKGKKGSGKGGGKDGGKHPRKSKDGKYTTDRHGRQLCFAWCRSADGCTNGQCPSGRSHVCEQCLQPHRTIAHKGGEGGRQDGGARHG